MPRLVDDFESIREKMKDLRSCDKDTETDGHWEMMDLYGLRHFPITIQRRVWVLKTVGDKKQSKA